MKGLVLEIPPFITTSTQISIQVLDNVPALNPLSSIQVRDNLEKKQVPSKESKRKCERERIKGVVTTIAINLLQ